MTTKRHGEAENRESFKDEKEKKAFEHEIDHNREHVQEEKDEKELKRFVREENRRGKELEEKNN